MWSQVTIFWETVGRIWETVLVPQNTLKKTLLTRTEYGVSCAKSSYVQPPARGPHEAQSKVLCDPFWFRCSISSLHTDNLSLFWYLTFTFWEEVVLSATFSSLNRVLGDFHTSTHRLAQNILLVFVPFSYLCSIGTEHAYESRLRSHGRPQRGQNGHLPSLGNWDYEPKISTKPELKSAA